MLTTRPVDDLAMARCLANLRPADRAEVNAAEVDDEDIILAARESTAIEGVWDGQTVFVYGVRPVLGVDGLGVPWMLSTNALAEADRSAVGRLAKRVVADWRRDFRVLGNLVHAKNSDAIKFIRWLGFHVKHEPAGNGGAFRMFVWSRHV